jgi:lipid-binding SYLF domain-containing protein/predicted outer membrane protein
VSAGEIAQSRGQDAALRDYGQRLVHDHAAANRELRRIAGNFAMTLPRLPSPAQENVLERLRQADAGKFDAEFMEQVGVEAHDRAIALFQHEANAPSADPALQHFARTTLPTLEQHRRVAENVQARAASSGAREHTPRIPAQPASGAQLEIREAVQVVHRMKSDPQVAGLLRQAKGVFILPDDGRAELGVPVQGRQGVLVTRKGEGFGNPVFYNMGGVSLGAQPGAAAGQVALLLMSDRAVQRFRSAQKFSLDAGAGLAIGTASARGPATGAKTDDVVVWSGSQGPYAGASVALKDVLVDKAADHEYYGRSDTSPQAILDGQLENPHNNVLGMVLAV